MAITKLLHMKECKGKCKYTHLKNAIKYILNEEKTKEGLYMNSNCGNDWKEILDGMLETKRQCKKEHGRQGYHIIVSFKKGEVDENTAYQIVGEFVERYLGDNYDYVYSVHNDKDHMHGHIIFNSVSYEGIKYHYANGDWKRSVQPVTDALCRKYGLSEILLKDPERKKERAEKSEQKQRSDEGKKGRSYAEWRAGREGKTVWRDIIRRDLDGAVRCCDTYVQILGYMRIRGYEISEKISKKYGDYLAIKPQNSRRAFRSYTLGSRYTIAELRKRVGIEVLETRYVMPPRIKMCRLQGGRNSYRVSSVYQLNHFQKYYRARHFYNYRSWQYRQNLIRIDQLSRNCSYLLKNEIRSRQELKIREEEIRYQEKELYSYRKQLQGLLCRQEPGSKEAASIQRANDRIAEINKTLQALREEKRIIRRIRRQDEMNKIPEAGKRPEILSPESKNVIRR